MSTNEETSYRAYWESVESIAKEAKEAEKNGDDAGDYIHESVDGSWWIIYTHASHAALMHSRNEDAAFEEMGSDALAGADSWSEVTQRLAFWAMRQDVHEVFAELPDEEEGDDAFTRSEIEAMRGDDCDPSADDQAVAEDPRA